MRLVLALVLSLAAAPAVFAANTAPAAPAPAPATDTAAPPVRFDWQGNHKKAQAALAQKDYKTAIKLFTDVINSGRMPHNWAAATYYLRGKSYRSAKQYPEAVADYLKAVEIDPKMDIAFYEMGASYQEMNNHAKAVEAFSHAIALKDNNAGYFYARCVSESWLNKFGEAANDCRKATSLKPGDADMLATLGRLYEDQGNKAQAIETYKEALAINPNQQDAKDGLAFLMKGK